MAASTFCGPHIESHNDIGDSLGRGVRWQLDGDGVQMKLDGVLWLLNTDGNKGCWGLRRLSESLAPVHNAADGASFAASESREAQARVGESSEDLARLRLRPLAPTSGRGRVTGHRGWPWHYLDSLGTRHPHSRMGYATMVSHDRS